MMYLREHHDVTWVVDGGCEQLGREGRHVDRDPAHTKAQSYHILSQAHNTPCHAIDIELAPNIPNGQPISVLKARLAHGCYLLTDDIDVRVAPFLRRIGT